MEITNADSDVTHYSGVRQRATTGEYPTQIHAGGNSPKFDANSKDRSVLPQKV